jgi:integrase
MPLQPLSNESINKILALLSRILDDAVERGYLRDNPGRRVRRLRHRTPRRPILEPHEVRAMFEAADRLDRRATGVTDKVLRVAELRREGLTYPQIASRLSIALSTAHYRQSRDEQAGDPIPFFRVWMRVLCAAGLRIDEACRARRCDVELIANCLRVGQAKTPAGVRTVMLTPDTVAALKRYLEMTSWRPATGPLLPTSNGTRYEGSNASMSIIRLLVAQTKRRARRTQPARAARRHHRARPAQDLLHVSARGRCSAALGRCPGRPGRPSTSLRIYTESLGDRERSQHGKAFDDLLNGSLGRRARHTPSCVSLRPSGA